MSKGAHRRGKCSVCGLQKPLNKHGLMFTHRPRAGYATTIEDERKRLPTILNSLWSRVR